MSRIFHILTSEDIEDVTSYPGTVVCAKLPNANGDLFTEADMTSFTEEQENDIKIFHFKRVSCEWRGREKN